MVDVYFSRLTLGAAIRPRTTSEARIVSAPLAVLRCAIRKAAYWFSAMPYECTTSA